MASLIAKLGTTGARVGGKAAAKKLAKTAAKSAAKKLAKGAVKAGTKRSGKKMLKKVGKKAAKGVGKKAAKAVGKKRMKEMVKKTAKKNLKKAVKKGMKGSKSEEKSAPVKVTPTFVSKSSKEEKRKKDIPGKKSKDQSKQTGAANKADNKKRSDKVEKSKKGKSSQETHSQSEDTMTSCGEVSRVKQDSKRTSKADESRKQKPTTSKESATSSKSEDTATSSSVLQEESRSTSIPAVLPTKPEDKRRNVFSSKGNTKTETPTNPSVTSTHTVSRSDELSTSAPTTAVTSGEAMSSTTEATGFTTPPPRISSVASRPSQIFTGDTTMGGGRRVSVMRPGFQEDQRPIKPRSSRTSVANVSIPESLKQSVHQDMLAKEAAKEVDDSEFNLMLFRLAKHLMLEGSNTQHSRAQSKERRRKKRRSSEWLQALSMILDAQNAKLAYLTCPNQPVRPEKPQVNPCCCCACGAIQMQSKEKEEVNKSGNEEKEATTKTLGEVKPKAEEVETSTEATPSTGRAIKVKVDREEFSNEITSTYTSSSGSSYTSSETSSDFSSQKFRDETDRLCRVIRVAKDAPHSRSEERPVAKSRPCLCDKQSKPPAAVRSAVHRSADDVSAGQVEWLTQKSQPSPQLLSMPSSPANKEAPQPPPPPPPSAPALIPIPPVAAPATATTIAPLASGLPASNIPVIAAPYIQPTLTLQVPCPPCAPASPSCCCSTNKDSRHVCCTPITSAICYPAANEVLTPVTLCTTQCEPAWIAGSTTQHITNPEFAVVTNYPDPNLLYNPDYYY